MEFCTFCGKQLADGEVCTCQQTAPQQNVYGAPQNNSGTQGTYTAPQGTYTAPQQGTYTAPQGGYNTAQGNGMPQGETYTAPQKQPKVKGDNLFTPVINSIKETAKNPLDAADTYYKTATLKTAITSMVTVVVLYVLVSIFNLLGHVWHILAIAKRSYGAFAYHYMDKGDILRYAGISGGTWVQAIFFPIVYAILMAAIVIGMAYLVNALVIKKDKVNLVNVARFGGAVSPAIGTALLVRFINGFVHVSGINGTILAGLYFAALVVALLQSLEIIRGMVSEKNKYVLATIILVAGLVIGDYLVGTLFLGHFYPYFSSIPMLL